MSDAGTRQPSARWRRLRWRSRELARMLRRTACRRLYRDPGGDSRRSVMIAGTARSGTTWLAEIIDSQIPSRLMFEPFHPDQVREYRQYEYFQYMRPDDDDPDLLGYCRKVIYGEIRHPWIDRRVEHLFPRLRVIKDIRTLLLLCWLRRQFPGLPILFLMRHPCAVVSSRLELGWDTDADVERFLRQPRFCHDHLADRRAVIDEARTPEEKHALVWCISNLVPLRQFARGELDVFYYESLCADPETQIPRLFRTLGRRHGDAALRALGRPSTTARRFSAVVTGGDRIRGWRRRLSAAQADRVLGIVERFGLGHLYDDSSMPLVSDPCMAGDG